MEALNNQLSSKLRTIPDFKKMTNIEWLQRWYSNECNGDWEHMYGVTISTLDNPGWNVEIDLSQTVLEQYTLQFNHVEESESDWYQRRVKDKEFMAAGDPSKLDFLIGLFRTIAEGGDLREVEANAANQ